MSHMIVMLIWVGIAGNTPAGAAAVIQGFPSTAVCEAAMPSVLQFYGGLLYGTQIECVDLGEVQ